MAPVAVLDDLLIARKNKVVEPVAAELVFENRQILFAIEKKDKGGLPVFLIIPAEMA